MARKLGLSGLTEASAGQATADRAPSLYFEIRDLSRRSDLPSGAEQKVPNRFGTPTNSGPGSRDLSGVDARSSIRNCEPDSCCRGGLVVRPRRPVKTDLCSDGATVHDETALAPSRDPFRGLRHASYALSSVATLPGSRHRGARPTPTPSGTGRRMAASLSRSLRRHGHDAADDEEPGAVDARRG